MGWKWGLDVVGCDGSEDAIKLGHSRNPHLNLSHCILSNSLPFKDSTVSNIVLNQVIEHLPMSVFSNVLSECRRILIPAGMLFIHSPNKANSHEVLKDPTHINPLYPSELRNRLRAAGFEIVAEPNSSRFLTGTPALSALIRRLMRTSLRDWLSATTNAYARKI
jgi:2-polyprenyl-3-methyl-5-hydroxy-6-metoxy-1,4-benzoquinol methylase